MTEALNVQDDMAREANSGAASVPQAFSGKVAFASSETQSVGGSQPPIDLKRRTFSADWAGNGDVGEFKRRRGSSQIMRIITDGRFVLHSPETYPRHMPRLVSLNVR